MEMVKSFNVVTNADIYVFQESSVERDDIKEPFSEVSPRSCT